VYVAVTGVPAGQGFEQVEREPVTNLCNRPANGITSEYQGFCSICRRLLRPTRRDPP